MENFSFWQIFGLLAISGLYIFWFKDIIKSYFSNFKQSLIYTIIFIISAIIIYNFMDNFLENKYEKNNRFKNIQNNSIQT